jgi:hypothetical protein
MLRRMLLALTVLTAVVGGVSAVTALTAPAYASDEDEWN